MERCDAIKWRLDTGEKKQAIRDVAIGEVEEVGRQDGRHKKKVETNLAMLSKGWIVIDSYLLVVKRWTRIGCDNS